MDGAVTARQTGWRHTYAGTQVGTYTIDGVDCEWWDIPTGTTVLMLDGSTKVR